MGTVGVKGRDRSVQRQSTDSDGVMKCSDPEAQNKSVILSAYSILEMLFHPRDLLRTRSQPYTSPEHAWLKVSTGSSFL